MRRMALLVKELAMSLRTACQATSLINQLAGQAKVQLATLSHGPLPLLLLGLMQPQLPVLALGYPYGSPQRYPHRVPQPRVRAPNEGSTDSRRGLGTNAPPAPFDSPHSDSQRRRCFSKHLPKLLEIFRQMSESLIRVV